MANNTVLNVGAGGDTMRDIDRTGVKTPVVGIDLGIGTGTESLMAGAMPVTGTFWQATQPISIASPVAVTGTFFQATQPVSGTVTVNAGTNLNTSLLALEAGGNLATLVTRTPALGQALAAASVPIVLTAAQLTTLTPVSTVTANAGTGNFTVVQSTAASLNATVVGTGTFAVQAAQSGTWNVGTVTTVTTVSTVTAVTAITNALPAGTNLLGQISASAETATIYSGTTALTPKFAAITASASGATTIVAAVGGKRIRVIRWSLSSNGSVNIKWQSHVTPTDLTGLHYLTQYASAGGAYCPQGIFQTVSGEALDINLSGAIAVGGELTYVEV